MFAVVLIVATVLPASPLRAPGRNTAQQHIDRFALVTRHNVSLPMMAMAAARFGKPGLAIDALLMDTPTNVYRANGHNHQRPGLTIYLPGNGALLYAAAMMAAGWDGAPDGNVPGFPRDGRWVVRWEGLRRAP